MEQVLFTVVALAAILSLVLKADSGLWLLFEHEEKFEPPWPITFLSWLTFAGMALILVGYFASQDLKRRHEEHNRSLLTPRERTISLYKNEQYEEITTLEITSPSSDATQILSLLARKPKTDSKGVTTQVAALIYEAGESTDIEVATLFSSKSWVKGSATSFVGDSPNAPVGIEDALKAAPLRRLAYDAEFVVCFGLASNEENDHPETNDDLSATRSVNLCRAVKNLDLIKREAGQANAVSLGFPESKAADSDDALLQRAGVIVAVTDAWQVLSGRDLALVVSKLATPNGVPLDHYRRSDGKYLVWSDVDGGEYLEPGTLATSYPKGEGFVVVPTTSGKNRQQ